MGRDYKISGFLQKLLNPTTVFFEKESNLCAITKMVFGRFLMKSVCSVFQFYYPWSWVQVQIILCKLYKIL
jgi:hypothetical protein